jgi:NSS family neurotransmitter:Na+ symporter
MIRRQAARPETIDIMQVTTAPHESWSSRLGFLMASMGAAVGLGNIWKFPYTLGSAGGSAFVIVYVIAVFVVAMPIMMGEMIIGRRGRMSPPNSLRKIAVEEGGSPAWRWLGWLGLVAVFIVLSFFSVVAGWSLAYVFKTATGGFTGVDPASAGGLFADFLHQPAQTTLWHFLFMAVTVYVVSRGINSGIERAMNVLMPGLFLMLLVLVGYGLATGAAARAASYLFVPDFSLLTPGVVLAAVGQAFFSVNVGIGMVLTYSAYLPAHVDLPRAAVVISLGDTAVALLAGLAIFPIVFANGLDPGAGPGLIFVTLSSAFGQMPGGSIFGALFFLFVFVAALTSAIAMVEMLVCRAEERGGTTRPRAAVVIGLAAFLAGLLTVGSFSWWDGVTLLPGVPLIGDRSIFDFLDNLVTNFMLPAGGMLFAVFAGWRLSEAVARDELGLSGFWFGVWRFLVRYVAPIAVGAVFFSQLAG